MLLGWFVSCLCEHALGCSRTCCCGFPVGINGWNPYLTVPTLVSPNKGRSQKGEKKESIFWWACHWGRLKCEIPEKKEEMAFTMEMLFYGRCCPAAQGKSSGWWLWWAWEGKSTARKDLLFAVCAQYQGFLPFSLPKDSVRHEACMVFLPVLLTWWG